MNTMTRIVRLLAEARPVGGASERRTSLSEIDMFPQILFRRSRPSTEMALSPSRRGGCGTEEMKACRSLDARSKGLGIEGNRSATDHGRQIDASRKPRIHVSWRHRPWR
jgi:hypothetical protein